VSHARSGGSRYRLTIMPNEPLERDRDSRQPHARPVRASDGSSGGSRRQGGGLRRPAGAGVVIVALFAVALAVTGVFASPNRSPDGVAVAGATHAPTDAPAPTPDPTPEASTDATEPSPAATEAPDTCPRVRLPTQAPNFTRNGVSARDRTATATNCCS